MPFASKRQQRAAFGGHIPGFSKEKAKEWADETDFRSLPERAASQKGKRSLLTKASSLRSLRRMSMPDLGVDPEDIRSGLRTLRESVEAAGGTQASPNSVRGNVSTAQGEHEEYQEQEAKRERRNARRRELYHLKKQRGKQSSLEDAQVSLCMKIAMPGMAPIQGVRTAMEGIKSMTKAPSVVGKFKGVATANSMKPPGRAFSSSVINPRRNVSQAMTAQM